MEKPGPKTRILMDYCAMIRYTEQKHGFNARDYHGKYHGKFGEEKDHPEPEYLDYWHWLLDNHFYNVTNGCIQYWALLDILEGDAPDWVKEISRKVYEDFKEHLDEEGGVEVEISW